uniref:RNA-directed DNA polymerase, eukaryota, reverse transcriptase zinc-binding domain protein n=1 Tax=Tanacetum cinerariifolium TaxID=118510 RepID=A0A6L2MCY8_TANCI|nr:hypothetical protein [Tanacetum cinerariifolium]
MRDMNVILKTSEHTMGGSCITTDMEEFEKCVNDIEVTDLCSSGMFFTWSKNLKSVVPGVMKKLDRIMVNEELLNKFNNAHAVFLLYLTSDHSPSMIIFSSDEIRKKKSFKFMNYISDKLEFIEATANG